MSNEYYYGQEAYEAGVILIKNPYDFTKERRKWLDWHGGWRNASVASNWQNDDYE